MKTLAETILVTRLVLTRLLAPVTVGLFAPAGIRSRRLRALATQRREIKRQWDALVAA